MRFRIDDCDDEITMFLKAVAAAAFPFLAFGGRRHPVRKMWGFRYLYVAWTLVAFAWLHTPVLNDDSVYMLSAPFLHIVSVVAFVAENELGGLNLSVAWSPFVLVGLTYFVVAVEFLRRKRGVTLLGLMGLGFPSFLSRFSDGDYDVPMESIDRKPADKSVAGELSLSDDVSTLFIGETGSGKSSGMMLVASQYPYDSDTATVVLDFGDDFKDFYDEYTDLETIGVRYRGSDVFWNLFLDIEEEDDFIEISTSIFGESDGRNPFHEPARQVFEDGLRYLYREAEKQDRLNDLGHSDILAFFQRQSPRQIARNLARYSDFNGSVSHLDGEKSEAPRRITAHIKKNLSEAFRGDIKKNGDFSLRDYIENPDGRILVIDPEPGKLDRIKPVITFFLNRAIDFSMNSSTEVNMVFDELDELDEIDNIQNLCARGRSHGTRCMIGVQTVGQLDAVYDKDKSGILGNCPQGMYFSPGDKDTLEHMKSEISEERKKKKSRSRSMRDPFLGKDGSSTIRYREKDQFPIPESELKNMGVGECVVVTRESWCKGKTTYWKDMVSRYV